MGPPTRAAAAERGSSRHRMQAPPGDVSAMTRAAIAVDAPATRDAAVAIAEAGGSAVDITVAAPRLHVGSSPDGAPLLLHEPGALDPLQPLTPERLRRFGLETVAQQAFAAPDMYFGGIKLAGRMADGARIG